MKIIALLILATATIVSPTHAASPATVDPTTLLPQEWSAFRYERLAVLRSQPKLNAQDQALTREIQTQQGKVEAAMIKADPTVAPVLARLEVLLKKGWKGAPAGTAPLTLSDWKKLRAARAAAFAANPDLAAESKKLVKQRKDLDAKIDAALRKADPSTAGYTSAAAWKSGS